MDEFEELDYYELLGISRNATTAEIKRAYRRQMARYHPDRFATASPEVQAAASRRARRINEAYATLSDFAARVAYNRTLERTRPSPTAPPADFTIPSQATDLLAELYTQAQTHLEAERYVAAVAILREIQRISPFYRDTADLLARAEAAAGLTASPMQPATPPDRRRRTLIIGGAIGLILVGGGLAGWLFRRQNQQIATGPHDTRPQGAAAAPANFAATPTATFSPTPTATPVATPTKTPTPTPRPSPTPVTIPETGTVLYSEDFSRGTGWPSVQGNGWSVGFASGAYQITAVQGAGNIWAYSTSPAGPDFLVGVDVEVRGGRAGLLLRFNDRNFLAYMVDPNEGSYRLTQVIGGRSTIIREERHPSIRVGDGARNRLAARLENNQISLRMNGQIVAELSVAEPPPTARYGMVAAATDARATALFRNLTLRALEP